MKCVAISHHSVHSVIQNESEAVTLKRIELEMKHMDLAVIDSENQLKEKEIESQLKEKEIELKAKEIVSQLKEKEIDSHERIEVEKLKFHSAQVYSENVNHVGVDKNMEAAKKVLPKFSETGDIDSYLILFERTMLNFNVDKQKWTNVLEPQLTGKIIKVLWNFWLKKLEIMNQSKRQFLICISYCRKPTRLTLDR